MNFVDTHCHIHSADYPLDSDQEISQANSVSVNKMMCVGTSVEDSRLAVKFVRDRLGVWATVGLHPHEAKLGQYALNQLEELVQKPKVMAIGECGLDYYYEHSPRKDQEAALRYHLELADKNNLPLVFHVRDAFEDFFRIVDDYHGVRGVVHSFTGTDQELEEALKRNFYVGINGIVTFTKREEQLETIRSIPLKSVLLETDSPFLTPVPERGKVNRPKNTALIARFLADLRGESIEELAQVTTNNAKQLFGI